MYTYTFPSCPVSFLGPSTRSPSISYDSAVSIKRTSSESSRPFPTASHARRTPPARLNIDAIIDVSYREELSYPPPTLAHFSRRSSPASRHFPRPTLRLPRYLPRTYFLPSRRVLRRINPRVSTFTNAFSHPFDVQCRRSRRET